MGIPPEVLAPLAARVDRCAGGLPSIVYIRIDISTIVNASLLLGVGGDPNVGIQHDVTGNPQMEPRRAVRDGTRR